DKLFKTAYCDKYYEDDKALGDFFWRISGKRLNFSEDAGLVRARVDRIVDRVQSILDMAPEGLHFKIVIKPVYETGYIALYTRDKNTITVYANKVTDGVFAHEVAHAVVCNYFKVPPPGKMQEILTQYVDKHLWDDY
ncbi:MAG TPA: hypothetical protein PKG81_08485, partial [Candidatus Omnitrophota bacterium]|nr:hypothetical protein [Candidatus Omnitrophota bacterium]